MFNSFYFSLFLTQCMTISHTFYYYTQVCHISIDWNSPSRIYSNLFLLSNSFRSIFWKVITFEHIHLPPCQPVSDCCTPEQVDTMVVRQQLAGSKTGITTNSCCCWSWTCSLFTNFLFHLPCTPTCRVLCSPVTVIRYIRGKGCLYLYKWHYLFLS